MARDREVWHAAVHAAAKIQTQLGPPTLLWTQVAQSLLQIILVKLLNNGAILVTQALVLRDR